MDTELTPQNVDAQLTVEPEIVAATDDATGDAYDVVGEPLESDDAPESEGAETADQPPDDGPDPAALAAEVERLRAEKRELDQIRAQMAQQEEARRQQQAAQWWQQQEAQAEAHFAAREQGIYAQAQQQYDPAAFIRQQMAALNRERSSWESQYRQTREQAVWQFAAQAYVPQYAGEVAQHYGLDAQSAQELMSYHPNEMPRMAAQIAERQKLRRELDQYRRSQAARTVGAASPAPGGGRATGGRIKAGSRAHLLHLLSQ